jgi:hypothetical protein
VVSGFAPSVLATECIDAPDIGSFCIRPYCHWLEPLKSGERQAGRFRPWPPLIFAGKRIVESEIPRPRGQ